MALNRYMYPQKGTNLVQQATIFTRVSIGATGAVTGIVAGRGITVARTGTGTYTATLDNSSSVAKIVDVSGSVTATPYAAGNHVIVCPTAVTESVVTFSTVNPQNGSAGDPPSGSELSLALVCTLSSVPA